MNLYIQIKDGQPEHHPLIESNVLQVWPDIDLNNLPPNLARFNRISQPDQSVLPVGNLQVVVGTYELAEDGTTYQDTWRVRDMDDEEKYMAIKRKKQDNQAQLDGFKEWTTSRIEATTGDTQTAWQNVLNQLNSLDIITDPFNIVWPTPPQFDADGDLIV